MKRKKKLILIGVLAIIYIIIALNFHKIKFALSMFRLYSAEKSYESVIDSGENNTQPILDNPLESIIEDENIVDKDEEVLDIDTNNVDKPKTTGDNSEDPSNNPKDEIIENNSNKSYKSIISDYNTKLEILRNTFEGELNNLITQGIKDYSKGNLSTTQLASRYLSIGGQLEKSSDTKFDLVVKDMEKELEINGHDTAIVKEVKNYYHSFKDAKKTDLISRGMKHVK